MGLGYYERTTNFIFFTPQVSNWRYTSRGNFKKELLNIQNISPKEINHATEKLSLLRSSRSGGSLRNCGFSLYAFYGKTASEGIVLYHTGRSNPKCPAVRGGFGTPCAA